MRKSQEDRPTFEWGASGRRTIMTVRIGGRSRRRAGGPFGLGCARSLMRRGRVGKGWVGERREDESTVQAGFLLSFFVRVSTSESAREKGTTEMVAKRVLEDTRCGTPSLSSSASSPTNSCSRPSNALLVESLPLLPLRRKAQKGKRKVCGNARGKRVGLGVLSDAGRGSPSSWVGEA